MLLLECFLSVHPSLCRQLGTCTWAEQVMTSYYIGSQATDDEVWWMLVPYILGALPHNSGRRPWMAETLAQRSKVWCTATQALQRWQVQDLCALTLHLLTAGRCLNASRYKWPEDWSRFYCRSSSRLSSGPAARQFDWIGIRFCAQIHCLLTRTSCDYDLYHPDCSRRMQLTESVLPTRASSK